MNVSALIRSQLPQFIASDKNYSAFVSFLEAYYEWMEQKDNISWKTANLLNFTDIDNTLDEFIDHFYNQYMPELPKYIAADKRKLIRFIREFYRSKGTSASYKFLFRVLFNSSCEIIETEQFVLKTSSGTWFNPTSIKLKSFDYKYFYAENYFVLGKKSGTLGKIERVLLVNEKLELILSDIKNTFDQNEQVVIVDEKKREVYFDDEGNRVDHGYPLVSLLYRPISNVKINPKFRGNYYFENNPVVVHGGLDQKVSNPIGAKVVVGSVNTGYITDVKVDANSCLLGYTENTRISVYPDNNKNTHIEVESIDYSANNTSNVKIITFSAKHNMRLAPKNITQIADANSSVLNAMYPIPDGKRLSELSIVEKNNLNPKYLNTGKLESVFISNGGGGFSKKPELYADSMYVPFENEIYNENFAGYDPRYDFDQNNGKNTSRVYKPLSNIGMLAPIEIQNGGKGYTTNDSIEFILNNKDAALVLVKANAIITQVSSAGAIKKIEYVKFKNYEGFIGGRSYPEIPKVIVKPEIFTSLTINTTINSNTFSISSPASLSGYLLKQADGKYNIIPKNSIIQSHTDGNIVLTNKCKKNATNLEVNVYKGMNAELSIPGFFGSTAKLIPITDRIGSINTFKVLDYGEDYSEAPSISLKIEDFIVERPNPILFDIKKQGDQIVSKTGYKAFVENITPLWGSNYICRVYDYNRSILSRTKKRIIEKQLYYLWKKSVKVSGNVITLETDGITTNCIVYVNKTFKTIQQIDIDKSTITLNDIDFSDTDDFYIGIPLNVKKLGASEENTDVDLIQKFNDHHINNGIYYDLKYSEDRLSYENGVITYGDGSARATAKYLNGIIIGDGRFLNETGHLSSYNLIQDLNHNSFTYKLSVEVELMKFKRILKDILHPAGTKVIPEICAISTPYKQVTEVELGNFDYVTYNSIHGILSTEESNASSNIVVLGDIKDDKITLINPDDIKYISNITLDDLPISNSTFRSVIQSYDKNTATITLSEKTTKVGKFYFTILNGNKNKLKSQINESMFILFDNDPMVTGTIIDNNTIKIPKRDFNALKLKGKKITPETIKIQGVVNDTSITPVGENLSKLKIGQKLLPINIDTDKIITSGLISSITTAINFSNTIKGAEWQKYDAYKTRETTLYDEGTRKNPYELIFKYEFSLLSSDARIIKVVEESNNFILTIDQDLTWNDPTHNFIIEYEDYIKIETQLTQ